MYLYKANISITKLTNFKIEQTLFSKLKLNVYATSFYLIKKIRLFVILHSFFLPFFSNAKYFSIKAFCGSKIYKSKTLICDFFKSGIILIFQFRTLFSAFFKIKISLDSNLSVLLKFTKLFYIFPKVFCDTKSHKNVIC